MPESLSFEVIDELLSLISRDVGQIILWREKIKRFKDDLDKQPITEDDFIYGDLYDFTKSGKFRDMPLSRTFDVNGRKLEVSLTHRHTMEPVSGVDLVYEISKNKIALIQYKKSHNGRFSFDRKQTSNLRNFCFDQCPAKKLENKPWFSNRSRIVSLCPCYYCLVFKRHDDKLFLPACIVESILDSKTKSRASANEEEFMRGMSKDSFVELFSKCWLGATYTTKDSVDLMKETLLAENHMVVYCTEYDKKY